MKKLFPSYVRVPLFFAIFFGILEFSIDSGDSPAFIKYPMVILVLAVFLFFLIAFEIVVSSVNSITNKLLSEEQRKEIAAKEAIPFAENKFIKGLLKSLTRSKPLEQEADVMLEHDYDGIKELDNVLPPWWVNLFYATAIFAVIYLARFEVFGDYNQKEEYEMEVQIAQKEIEKFKEATPNLFDESKLVLLTDAESLAKGKEVFTNACAACHRADGGGQIGPNLTDEYWIDGGGIKNVFHTISNGGREGKGMVPWKATLKPDMIQNIASYVISLQGSNPKNPKPTEPEAKKWEEAGTSASADSTKVAK